MLTSPRADLRSIVAVLLAMTLCAHAAVGGQPPRGGAALDAAPPAVDVEPLAAWAAVATQRQRVAEALVELGRPATHARALAAQLDAADLAVLTANPLMLQAAGDSNARRLTLLWGVLIVAGLIALAAATDGFVSFH